MSNITKPIVQREWELIRDRIGLILAQELATQAQLDYNDVLFELPDVYIERFVPVSHEEMPAVNVMVAQGEYNQETQQTQDGTWTFYIDGYCTAKDEDGQRGDQYASMRLHRLMGICQAIIMDSRFKTLLFEPGAISNRTVKGIMMADPTKAMEATNAVMARMTVEVRVSDDVELIDSIPLAEYATIAKMSDTDLGYLWGGTSTFTPPSTCSDSELNVNGVFLANIPSGEEFNLVVVDTGGNVVGDAYGNTIIVPAVEADPVTMTFNTAPISETPAGGAKAISVRGSDASAKGTATTDTASSLVVDVADSTVSNSDDTYSVNVVSEAPLDLPDVTHTDSDGSPVILPAQTPLTCTPSVAAQNSATPFKTGAVRSDISNDDGTQQFGRGADYWNLSASDRPTGNFFGSLKRFTGITGGYEDELNPGNWYDVDDNPTTEVLAFPDDIIIDWSTEDPVSGAFYMWYRIPSAAINGSTAVQTDAPGQSYGGWSGWRVPNIITMLSIYNYDAFSTSYHLAWDVVPFHISRTSFREMWSCSPSRITNRLLTYSSAGVMNPRVFTQSSVYYFPFRIGNTSEL